jgi:hypothetical protein
MLSLKRISVIDLELLPYTIIIVYLKVLPKINTLVREY